jgi:excisionase family DNA binding protein
VFDIQVTSRTVQMEPLLDARSVAQLLGVSYKTMRRMVNSDEFLAPVVIGKRQRWRLKDVERWVASGGGASRPGADAREVCSA